MIVKVGKALKDKEGASFEYQHVQLELRALKTTLEHLQSLQPTGSDASHIDAIRGVALACQIPLQDFLQKIAKFEASMGPFSRERRVQFSVFGRKTQWTLFVNSEVAKLRAIIGAKVISINLLLGIQTRSVVQKILALSLLTVILRRESVSQIARKSQEQHDELLSQISQFRSNMSDTQDSLSKSHSYQEQQLESMKNLKESIHKSTRATECISTTTHSINRTVVSMRTVGVQLLQM